MSNIYIIYKYINIKNGKSYIGQTFREDKRKNEHKNHSGNCIAFNAAIKKYGFNNFNYVVLERNILDRVLANKREQYFIKEYKTFGPNGYNLTKGGDGLGGVEGEKSSNSKLTEKQVIDIIASPISHNKAAKLFDVDIGNIWQIRNGHTWKYLSRINAPTYINDRQKTTENTATKIIQDPRSHTVTANEYNISVDIVYGIRSGKNFKHLNRDNAPIYTGTRS